MTVTEWRPSQIVVTQRSESVSTWSVQEIVEEHDGYWTVVDPHTGIFGSGGDRATALDDFEQALREHFDVLSRQDSLSDELRTQLAYLRLRFT